MAQSKPPSDKAPFLGVFGRLLQLNQQNTKIAQAQAGISGGQIDASHLTGKVSGDTLLIEHTAVPSAVAAAGAAGASGTVSSKEHVHPHGTGYLPDAHHAKAHAHNGADGSGTVAHAAITGQTTDDHHAKAHAHSVADATGTVAHASLSGLTTGDPHTQYQQESEKGVANGYAGLGAGGLVPVAQLGSGTPTGTKFLRDDGTLAVPAGTSSKHVIADEGTPLTERATLDFAGAGVTVTDDAGGNRSLVTIPGASGGHTVQDEGTSLTARTKLNFKGAGVTATDNAGADSTDVTIPGGSGGNTTYANAWASPPGSPAAGDLWFPSDAPYLGRYSGTAWVWTYLGYICTIPNNAGATWLNQGAGGAAATSDATRGSLYLSAKDSADAMKIRYWTIPSSPYKLTAMFVLNALAVNYVAGGLVLLDNANNGRTLSLESQAQGKNIQVATMGTGFTVTANPFYASIVTDPPTWFQIEDDNTDRIFRIGYTPRDADLIEVYRETRTTLITPTRYGVYINPRSGYKAGLDVYSLREN